MTSQRPIDVLAVVVLLLLLLSAWYVELFFTLLLLLLLCRARLAAAVLGWQPFLNEFQHIVKPTTRVCCFGTYRDENVRLIMRRLRDLKLQALIVSRDSLSLTVISQQRL